MIIRNNNSKQSINDHWLLDRIRSQEYPINWPLSTNYYKFIYHNKSIISPFFEENSPISPALGPGPCPTPWAGPSPRPKRRRPTFHRLHWGPGQRRDLTCSSHLWVKKTGCPKKKHPKVLIYFFLPTEILSMVHDCTGIVPKRLFLVQVFRYIFWHRNRNGPSPGATKGASPVFSAGSASGSAGSAGSAGSGSKGAFGGANCGRTMIKVPSGYLT